MDVNDYARACNVLSRFMGNPVSARVCMQVTVMTSGSTRVAYHCASGKVRWTLTQRMFPPVSRRHCHLVSTSYRPVLTAATQDHGDVDFAVASAFSNKGQDLPLFVFDIF